jgi:hypothetical protein
MVYDSSGNLAPAPIGHPQWTAPLKAEVATAADQSASYSSRFENEGAAIDYAQNSGQGVLEVSSSGVITNQFGETMVYDSSGNLAPAPRMTPVEDEAAANAAIAAARDPVAVAKAAQAAREADPNWVDPAINNPDYVDPVAAAIAAASARTDATQSTSNSSRFDNETAAVEYAQNSGQGALEVSSSGAITNKNGETMVYDSDGNLAPAPRATPVEDNSAPQATPDPVAVAANVASAREAFMAGEAAKAAANEAIAADRAADAAAALAEAMKLLSYSVSDTGTSSADLVATPFATAESSASLQVLGVPEFNLSTDLFI